MARIKEQLQQQSRAISLLCFVILLPMLLYRVHMNSLSFTFARISNSPVSHPLLYEKSSHKLKYNVSALVFFGRRQYVEILNCYLERNLRAHSGILSEVIFVSKTQDQNDLIYLHKLVADHQGTYFIKNDTDLGWTFHAHYRDLDPNRYYVKIDDDVLYIHPDTIESMLETKLSQPDALFISANVVNHPVIGGLHLQLMALINTTQTLPKAVETGIPICDWQKSECAHLHHRSFLERIEENSLDAYMFPLWDNNAFGYSRWSINFILFKGDEVREVGPGDDEHQISIEIPRKHRKHSLVVGKALVVHFGYIPQRRDGLKDDNFLPRYRQIAQKVCQDISLSNSR